MLSKRLNKRPSVSIIINCKDCADFVTTAIKSVMSQEYCDWEIVFFDNLSQDNSVELVRRFKDDRLKIFSSAKRLKLGAARNEAMKFCEGDYLAFLDADDIWHKDKLRVQLKAFERSDDITLIYNTHANFSRDLSIVASNVNASKVLASELLMNYDIPMSSVIIKKKVIDDNKISFQERFQVLEDKYFFLEVAQFGKVVRVDLPLSFWRIHSTSETHQKFHRFAIENEILFNDLRTGVLAIPDLDWRAAEPKMLNKIRFQTAISCWQQGNGSNARKVLLDGPLTLKFILFLPWTYLPPRLYSLAAKIYLTMSTKAVLKGLKF